MVFASTVFLFIFLPVTLAIYFNPFIRSRRFKNIFLLIDSLLFYAWGEPVGVFLMIFCIIIGWLIGGRIQSAVGTGKAKAYLTLGISLYLVIFFIFKYLTFVSNEIAVFLHRDKGAIEIALPIGISFYLFQLMSYLFDIYYRKAEAQKNILNLGLYISMFPQLIAGPIVRYSDIEEQIENRQESMEDFSYGMVRFVFGLGKKVLLANNLGVLADNIFSIDLSMPILTAWIGAAAYTLQIFFDFSGYSDMAIGMGRMFGFKFSENFNHPYISKSVTEFWRRWHISLSTWFRDYVYIPMGGNRVSRRRWVLNLFVVWALTGIWHGANWTFLLWGLIYFVVLLAEKLILVRIKRVPPLIGHIYTMVIVIVAWVVFRADTLKQAFIFISNMFYSYGNGFLDRESLFFLDNGKWFLLLGIFFSTAVPARIMEALERRSLKLPIVVFNFAVFVLSLMSCISVTYNPFIYFAF